MTTSTSLDTAQKKHLRKLGHSLNPVVTVAGNGLSESVIAEIDRALTDHELIKVKLVVGDRDLKAELIAEICRLLNAQAVQIIGHIVLLYKKAKRPDPRLSNLLR